MSVQYGIKLYKNYPNKQNSAQKFFDKMQEYEAQIQISNYHGALEYFQKQSLSTQVTDIYKHLLHKVLEDEYRFLSTPSHSPSWIALTTLIERLEGMEKDKIDIFDFEIAINRVVCDIKLANLDNSLSKLDRELAEILLYLFASKKLNVDEVQNPNLWLVALVRKNNIEDYHTYFKTFVADIESINPFYTDWKAYRKPWEYEEWRGGKKVKVQTTTPKLTLMRSNTISKVPFETIYYKCTK